MEQKEGKVKIEGARMDMARVRDAIIPIRPIQPNPATPLRRNATMCTIHLPSDGIPRILLCRRGILDAKYGKIFTTGGGVDAGEEPPHAAVRETWEEAGLVVEERNTRLLVNERHFFHYWTMFRSEEPPVVLGEKAGLLRPLRPGRTYEIIHDDEIGAIFGVPVLRFTQGLYQGKSNGYAWVPLDHVLQHFARDLSQDQHVHRILQLARKAIETELKSTGEGLSSPPLLYDPDEV